MLWLPATSLVIYGGKTQNQKSNCFRRYFHKREACSANEGQSRRGFWENPMSAKSQQLKGLYNRVFYNTLMTPGKWRETALYLK